MSDSELEHPSAAMMLGATEVGLSVDERREVLEQ